ncbi:MAG: asparagine synthetase B, partial [Thiomonas sp.]
LSGGLDSSIVTTLIRHCTDTPLRTFSLTFDDAEFDESVWQQQLVRHLGTEHTTVHCTHADIAAAFPRAIAHAETPIVRTAPAPMMLLAAGVRAAGYKVALTGEGADEVFGGYDLFKEARVRRFIARQPQSRCRPRLLERLYPYLKHSPAAGRAMAERFFRAGEAQYGQPGFGHLPRWTTTRRISQFLSADWRHAATAFEPSAALAAQLPADIACWEPLAQDQYIEAHTLMSGYLLCAQGDRMAMAQSVETRFPFLDHRLIAFASRLPARYKLMGLTEKWLLKHSMDGLLPQALRHRSKQPYRTPDSQSFFHQGEPADYVAELFSAARLKDAGYFDPQAALRLFDKARAGKIIGFGDNMAFVGMLSTLLLHEQFIRRAAP